MHWRRLSPGVTAGDGTLDSELCVLDQIFVRYSIAFCLFVVVYSYRLQCNALLDGPVHFCKDSKTKTKHGE